MITAMSDIASYEPDIANYEQLWNSFKAARENKEPHKTTTVKSNDEFYIDIVNVDSQSGHEIENKLIGITESKDDLKESCDICGKQVQDLDKHMVVNHEKDVKCQLCSKTFLKGNLRLHILKEHWRNEIAKCTLCETKFETMNAMKSHVKKNHINKSTICDICHKEYKYLQVHIKFFHDKFKPFECSYCKNFFHSKRRLNLHVQSNHLQKKINCPGCKMDISVYNFSRHVKEFHENKKKACSICGKEFGMSNHRRHIRMVHNNETTQCPHCGKFITSSTFNKHINRVHTKLNKMCDLCKEEIPYFDISVHKRKVHNIGKPLKDGTSSVNC